jgi:HAD superfamily hydrolase (TIGR01509 family)
MKPAAVLVDAGRVLIHPDDSLFQQAAQTLGCRLREGAATTALGRTVWDGAASADPIAFWNGTAKIRAWARHAGLSRTQGRAVWNRVHELDQAGTPLWSRVEPGARAALRRLTDAGLQIAVVSNNDGRLHRQLSAVGLDHHFAAIVDSAVVGTAKPSPEIFAYAATELGLHLHQCVMIGDDPYFDIRASLLAGIPTAILIDPGADRPAKWRSDAYPDLSSAVQAIIPRGS